MQLRDYLAFAAILLSLASFGVALWSARFNRRVKHSELRAAVLIKAAEISTRITRIYEFRAQMREHAEELSDAVGLDLFDVTRLERIQDSAGSVYTKMAALPSNHGLKIYEIFFHELNDLSDQSLDLEQSSKAIRDRYLAIAKVPGSGA